MTVGSALADPGLAAVVSPDRETARRWALEELSRPEYAEARPNALLRAITWLLDRLDSLLVALPGPPDVAAALLAGVTAVLAVLAAVVVTWLVTRSTRRSTRRRGAAGPVFGDAVRTAAEHREAARAAAERDDWREAVQESFRAVARRLEERGVLDALPGRTADEIAVDAAAALPEAATGLHEAARLFDDVSYGGRPGSRAGYDQVAALDATLERSRPRLVTA